MRRYVKSEKGYEKSFETDWKAVKSGLKKARASASEPKKVPTSIALDPRLLADLKKEAAARGVPYQILMRMFIIEGFQKLRRWTLDLKEKASSDMIAQLNNPKKLERRKNSRKTTQPKKFSGA